jgi:pimeloyl-ACP methyl ester carboxylesterase
MRRTAVVIFLGSFFLCVVSLGRSQSLDSITRRQSGKSMRASSGNPIDNADSEHFAIGETKTIAHLEGPGEVRHIWLVPSSMDIRYPRALVLRIYWDGADVPSVEAPLGDFHAVGNGMRANVNSLPVKVSSYGRGYNSYWRMPFRKEARITLSNESDKESASCYYQIDWVKYEQVPEDMMYFHARYHQEYPPEKDEPYTVFVGKGRGHYVGTVLSSQNGMGHWFGEGDDLFTIDGEEAPSIVGTGTEDYFNEAWNMRVHSGLYNGCTVFEPRAPDARVTAYRWHIPDPIIFNQSLTFTIERRGYVMDSQGEVVSPSGSRPDFWSSVSFWYQDTVAEPWCEFPSYRERVNPEIVLHLPQVVDTIRHSSGVELEVNPYNRATYTKPWFRVRNDTVGSWIEIPFEVREGGKYSISLFQHLREDNGIWKVYIDDKEIYEAGESQIAGGYRVSLVSQLPPEKINKTLDFYNMFLEDEHENTIYGRRRERKIGLFEFARGTHTLKLVCIGANPLSFNPETGKPGLNLSADVLSVRKVPFEGLAEEWVKEVVEKQNEKEEVESGDVLAVDLPVPTPRQMLEEAQKTLPPLSFTIEKDEIVPSATFPDRKLRRIEIEFCSQIINGVEMRHDAVIYTPLLRAPGKNGKVVIVAHPFGDDTFELNYAEPMAARTGYPTMALLLPGTFDEEDGEGKWLRTLRDLARETGNPSNHDFVRSGLPYLRALDVFSDILKDENIRAVIGGHSKRAYYAFTAAAMDPERIAGVVFMGCERLYVRDEFPEAVNPFSTQKYVQSPVFYIGATNEDGYEMFAINTIQEEMNDTWTIEYIPNYRHAARSEKQFMDWLMWVSHIFDGRRLSRISDLSLEETEKGTLFRASIDSPNTLIQAKIWYVYCDDIPYWRDLVWYPELMKRKGGNLYEGYVEGKLPDAWLVEVKDTAGGFAGYVSSLPRDITGKPTKERVSRGSRSRLWAPKNP